MNYEKPSFTVDCVVFNYKDNAFKILLIERGHEPFKGKWALPGGFVDQGELSEHAALRELEEETGIKLSKDILLVSVNSNPERDPRGWVISASYLTVIPGDFDFKAGDDAAKASLFDINDLPEMAFDHEEIIQKALEKIKFLLSPIDNLPVLFQKDIGLNQVRNIYSLIKQK